MGEVRLRYALLDGQLACIDDFSAYRGSANRPDSLTCPECDKKVIMKLSPALIVADHFAHYADSDCPLQKPGESARHFNAKMKMASILRAARSLAVQFSCRKCGQPQAVATFPQFDSAHTELKIQSRRPDISLFSNGVLAGCVEIYHQCRMNQERIQDMSKTGKPWFEVSVQGAESWCKTQTKSKIDLTMDAVQSDVTAPRYSEHCDTCQNAIQEKAQALKDPAFWPQVYQQTKWQVACPDRAQKPDEIIRRKCDDLIAMINIGSDEAVRQMNAMFIPPADSDFAFLLENLAAMDRANLIKSAAIGLALGMTSEEAAHMAVMNYLKRQKAKMVTPAPALLF